MRYNSLSRTITAKYNSYKNSQQKASLRNTFFFKKSVPAKVKSFGQLAMSVYGVGFNTAASACCDAGVHYGTPIAAHQRSKLQELFSAMERDVTLLGKPVGASLSKLERAALKFKARNGFVSGIRQLQHLPSRGQRTKTNARSTKGRKKVK